MNRALRCLTSLLAGLLLVGRASSAEFPGTLVLGRPTDTLMAANVISPSAVSLYLEYGTRPGVYDAQSAAVDLPANQPREIELKGLAAGTRHFYRIRFKAPAAAGYDAGSEFSFMTARPPGASFVFGVQGDSHPERARQMFDAALYTRAMQNVAGATADFFVMLGDDFSVDTINQANPRAVTQPQVVERYLIQRPYLGILGRTTPVFLVNGNHEQAARYLLDGTPNNVAVWAQNARNSLYPQPAPDAFYSGNPELIEHIGLLRNYFAWTWGDALFVCIDPYWGSPVVADNDFYGGPKTSDPWLVTHGEAQYQWLKRTLEGSRARFKFVFAHHVMGTGRGGIEPATRYEWGGLNANGTPGFSARRPTWPKTIHQLFVDNKVTIFFGAHDHIWVRQQLDGVIYQAMPNPADPNYSLFNSDAYLTGDRVPNSGYARVTVAPTGVKVDYVRAFLPADETAERKNGMVSYTYTIGSMVEAQPAPTITQQPVNLAVAAGATATFSVSAVSTLPISYQWRRDGVAIAGATAAQHSIPGMRAADAGSYSVLVSTSAGSVLSTTVSLELGASRLVNLSVRSGAGTGDRTLIAGFVVGPGQPLPLLVRGIGPALTGFGVTGALADPVLTLTTGTGAAVAANDDWGSAPNATQISAAAARSGAFALTANARDAALLTPLAPGPYTAQITGKAAATGIALMEAYDNAAAADTARLVNISARSQVGTGGDILIAGFVVAGNVTKRVLIRGVGPALAQFGVGGVLADPQLSLYRQGSASAMAQNDNWLTATNAPQVGLAAGQVGAFSLAPNSRDAALLVTLEPGAYTAQVSGVGNSTGVALIEIYEVP